MPSFALGMVLKKFHFRYLIILIVSMNIRIELSFQEKEKESWEAAFQALKMKLEISESNCIRAEIEAAKMRSIFVSLS